MEGCHRIFKNKRTLRCQGLSKSQHNQEHENIVRHQGMSKSLNDQEHENIVRGQGQRTCKNI